MTKETRACSQVRKRDDVYAQKIKTRIWSEDVSEDNPYVAQTCRIHGYELTELSDSISFIESVYLNIKGELPDSADKALLEALFVALSNPGPRHPATRAVMSAAVSKTQVTHLLPIGLSILSGEHNGAGEVERAVKFIRKNINKPPSSVAEQCQAAQNSDEGQHYVAGFGTHYGDIDIVAQKLAEKLSTYESADRALQWGMAFSNALNAHGQGWLLTGLAGACFVDLGFTPKASAGLFQIAAAPGLLAHGLEMATKPLTAMPFIDDSDYHYLKK